MRFLLHNCIAHPLAGLLWFLGLDAAGDAIHQFGLSDSYDNKKEER